MEPQNREHSGSVLRLTSACIAVCVQRCSVRTRLAVGETVILLTPPLHPC